MFWFCFLENKEIKKEKEENREDENETRQEGQ